MSTILLSFAEIAELAKICHLKVCSQVSFIAMERVMLYGSLELHGQLLVVYSALCVEIGIVETASIKPQRGADVTRGYHPFPIPLTLQSMVQCSAFASLSSL